MYFVRFSADRYILLLLHVDDGFGWGDNPKDVENFLATLGKKYTIKSCLYPKSFLKIDIDYKSDVSITLSQEKYITDAVDGFGVKGVPTKTIPIKAGTYLSPGSEQEQQEVGDEGIEFFMSVVGTIGYLANKTRSDISFVHNQLSQFIQKPTKAHIEIAIDVLLYPMHTKNFALRYGVVQDRECRVVCYSDANFPPTPDAKATAGSCIFLVSHNMYYLIAWHTNKLKHICDSTEHESYPVVQRPQSTA